MRKATISEKKWRTPYIMEYDVNTDDMRNILKVKEFKKTSEPWLKFVLLNRNKLIQSEYDVVIGATADAAAQAEIESFYRYHKNRKPSKKEYRFISKTGCT